MDYLFYATVERGKVYETGAFIHNYALCYALHLATSPYFQKIQKPVYKEDLQPLNKLGIYLTPASPIKISHRLTQWNTIQEAYGFPKKERNIGYPDWGFARVIRPGSIFEFYVIVNQISNVEQFPNFSLLLMGKIGYIRLGKFLAKSRIRLMKAQKVQQNQGSFSAGIINDRGRLISEQNQSSLLLNWRDIPADPITCDIYPATLPTRLIANPKYDSQSYYVAEFGEEDQIKLPANMSFVARDN
ncbi:MAG: type I-D CRISPR-associated protein Cas5/Csc1 [Phormidium sp.]